MEKNAGKDSMQLVEYRECKAILCGLPHVMAHVLFKKIINISRRKTNSEKICYVLTTFAIILVRIFQFVFRGPMHGVSSMTR